MFVKSGDVSIPDIRGCWCEEICYTFHGSCMVCYTVSVKLFCVQNSFLISLFVLLASNAWTNLLLIADADNIVVVLWYVIQLHVGLLKRSLCLSVAELCQVWHSYKLSVHSSVTGMFCVKTRQPAITHVIFTRAVVCQDRAFLITPSPAVFMLYHAGDGPTCAAV